MLPYLSHIYCGITPLIAIELKLLNLFNIGEVDKLLNLINIGEVIAQIENHCKYYLYIYFS